MNKILNNKQNKMVLKDHQINLKMWDKSQVKVKLEQVLLVAEIKLQHKNNPA